MSIAAELSTEQKNFAVDSIVTLTVEEIAKATGDDPTSVLYDFVASRTGMLLYDESSKLWWNGPSYVADMYLAEKGRLSGAI